jgi:transcriptional regulator with XRE-family HTH domain
MREQKAKFMELNYKDIGFRIKEERLRQKITQERLAEMATLSMTHMSHIETGNTKLSLPALHKIAWALGVTMDEFACDSVAQAKPIYEGEIFREIKDCDETEIRVITDMIKTLKESLRKRIQKQTD